MLIFLELETSIYHDEVSDFNLARVTLDDKKIAWIIKMEKIVRKLDIANLSDYDCSLELFNKDGDEPPEITPYNGSTECDMIRVQKYGFDWKGLLKHTEIRYGTTFVQMKELRKLIKFYNRPMRDMPKYINDKDYSKREIALHRMREGS